MLQVRHIQEGDLAELTQLYVQCFNAPPWHDAWSLDAARERLTEIYRHPRFLGLLAPAAGSPTALVMGYCERCASGMQFYLREMCVAPSHQRKGIGASLLAALLSRLREAGVAQIYLETSGGGAAEAFYRKAGFQVVQLVGMFKYVRPRRAPDKAPDRVKTRRVSGRRRR